MTYKCTFAEMTWNYHELTIMVVRMASDFINLGLDVQIEMFLTHWRTFQRWSISLRCHVSGNISNRSLHFSGDVIACHHFVPGLLFLSTDGVHLFERKRSKATQRVFFFLQMGVVDISLPLLQIKTFSDLQRFKKTGIESKGRNETNKRRIRRKQSFGCCCCGRNEFSCRPSASTSRCRCPKLLPLLLPLRLINNYLPPETFRRVFQKSPLWAEWSLRLSCLQFRNVPRRDKCRSCDWTFCR